MSVPFPPPTSDPAQSSTRRRFATSSNCSMCGRERWLHGWPHPGLLSANCRRWSVTPPRRRSARPLRRRPATSIRGLIEQVAGFAEMPGPPVVVFQDLDGPVDVGHLRRGDVHHLQGIRSRRPDHQRGRPRSRSGRGAQFPLLRRRRHLPHGYCHILQIDVADPRRRRHGPSRRPAARRPQRRHHDSPPKSPRPSPSLSENSWPPSPSCSIT